MERERIDSSGARVWGPKRRVAADSIPQTSPRNRRGRHSLNQVTEERRGFLFI
jgi:hypothetical protein